MYPIKDPKKYIYIDKYMVMPTIIFYICLNSITDGSSTAAK